MVMDLMMFICATLIENHNLQSFENLIIYPKMFETLGIVVNQGKS